MLEFSGERVVPGLVDENLFNEHLARYRFATRFLPAPGQPLQARILDAGCGTGYGGAQFVGNACVVGIDIAEEAVRHAREAFGRPGISFLQASCDAIPFAEASFDLVMAFEVIEHLERWPDLLRHARRVLRPGGVFLVSTPNKTYYAESRASAGPNPYHVHEFEYAEFHDALTGVFPHVLLWTQNHAEGIAFTPVSPTPSDTSGLLDVAGAGSAETAHFFFAACSAEPIAHADAFAWLPAGGNLLREREHHIALLEEEVRRKSAWLDEQTEKHATLNREHDALLAELHQHNDWATNLNHEIAQARESIDQLQNEARERLHWVQDLEGQIARGKEEIERRGEQISTLQKDYATRSQWGEEKAREVLQAVGVIEALEARIAALEQRHAALRGNNWIRLGSTLGLIRDAQ